MNENREISEIDRQSTSGQGAPEDAHGEFSRLFMSAQPVLRRFVMAHVGGYHNAEDALQRTGMALWEKFAQYDRSRPFAKWAMGVAWREVLMARRRTARDRLVLTEEVERKIENRLIEQEPDEDLRQKFLVSCVSKLQSNQKTMFNMKYRDNLPCDTIAQNIGRSPNAIRILLFRIRDALRECIRREAETAEAGQHECT